MAKNNNAKKLMPTISSARTAHLSIRPYPPDGNGSDRCFLADMPIEPAIAVDILSRMVTSFIIRYLEWYADNNVGSFGPYSDYPLTGLLPRNAPTGISRPQRVFEDLSEIQHIFHARRVIWPECTPRPSGRWPEIPPHWPTAQRHLETYRRLMASSVAERLSLASNVLSQQARRDCGSCSKKLPCPAPVHLWARKPPNAPECSSVT